MKKSLLRIIIFFCFVISTSASAWDSNIKENCVNENLDPCSASDITAKNSNTKSNSNINKVVTDKRIEQTKKIVNKKVIKSEKKISNKITKIDKINFVKDYNKKKLIKNLTNTSDKKYNFDKNMSFDDFKTLVINYTDNSNYPNINN